MHKTNHKFSIFSPLFLKPSKTNEKRKRKRNKCTRNNIDKTQTATVEWIYRKIVYDNDKGLKTELNERKTAGKQMVSFTFYNIELDKQKSKYFNSEFLLHK